ncbi:MAG: T9SS type A sorting domain-containing protein [Flavobacteriales bacterium]
MKKKLLFTALLTTGLSFAQAQYSVQVKVVSVETLNNVDCDGWPLGDSDFVFEFLALDNTVGNTNNNPSFSGIMGACNYAYKNEDNGPYTLSTPSGAFDPNDGLFFNHNYQCSQVPTQIIFRWRAYENDAITNYSAGGGSTQGQTANQMVTLNVPTSPTSNMYTYTAASQDAGCPQNYRITIELETSGTLLSNDVTQNGAVLTAVSVSPFITYQWVDCLNGNSPIPGATGQNFTVTQNGSYAVEITDGLAFCTVTSNCITINNVGINEESFGTTVLLYPNPVNDILTIELGEAIEQATVEIFDLSGKRVAINQMRNENLIRINTGNFAKGVYMVSLSNTKGNKAIYKLVKQ